MQPSRLPLPLELTKPVLLAGDVDTLVRDRCTSSYDPKTQLCSDGSSSEQTCESWAELLVIDLQIDGIVIDDILFF